MRQRVNTQISGSVLFMTVMMNTDCQLHRISNDPGDKSLGMSVREFLFCIN